MNKFRKPHGNGGREGGRFSNSGAGRPGFEQRPARTRFGGPRPEGVELFDAICAKCGNACQVPFRPNGQKPVYCRACFGNPQNSAGKETFVRRDVPMKSFEPRPENNREIADLKQQVSAMSSKLDSILGMMEKMSRPAITSTATSPMVAMPKKKVVKKKAATKKK